MILSAAPRINWSLARTKMQWLNAISLECELSSTSFRFAYLMADHINRVAGFAWPALTRLADKICLSNKSTLQAVRELESAGELGSSSAPKKLQPPSHVLVGRAKACAE
jgi:hypothetical protein